MHHSCERSREQVWKNTPKFESILKCISSVCLDGVNLILRTVRVRSVWCVAALCVRFRCGDVIVFSGPVRDAVLTESDENERARDVRSSRDEERHPPLRLCALE